MQRRSVTDSRAEVQLVQTGRYGKKEAEALVGSVTRYPPTRHSDRRIVMDAYQVMDYKEEKEEEGATAAKSRSGHKFATTLRLTPSEGFWLQGRVYI